MPRNEQLIALRFHRSLYPQRAIQTAMEAFLNLARFELQEDVNYTRVDIEPLVDAPAEEIAGEFANHVLARTVEEKRS